MSKSLVMQNYSQRGVHMYLATVIARRAYDMLLQICIMVVGLAFLNVIGSVS